MPASGQVPGEHLAWIHRRICHGRHVGTLRISSERENRAASGGGGARTRGRISPGTGDEREGATERESGRR